MVLRELPVLPWRENAGNVTTTGATFYRSETRSDHFSQNITILDYALFVDGNGITRTLGFYRCESWGVQIVKEYRPIVQIPAIVIPEKAKRFNNFSI